MKNQLSSMDRTRTSTFRAGYPKQTYSSIPSEHFLIADGIDRKRAYLGQNGYSVDEQMLAMKKIMTEQQKKLELLSSKLSQDDGLEEHCTLVARDDSAKLRQSHERRRASVESLIDGQSGNFPSKLYHILELTHTQKFGASSDAVAWLHHGRAFKILDEQVFMTSIVPMFFKQTKIRSFYRQLNLWGFKKITSGRDIGAWCHENFIRGEPLAIMKMERAKIKRASSRLSDVESQENVDVTEILPVGSVVAVKNMVAEGASPKPSVSLNQTSTDDQTSKEFDLSILSKIRREVASAFKVGNSLPSPVSPIEIDGLACISSKPLTRSPQHQCMKATAEKEYILKSEEEQVDHELLHCVDEVVNLML